jgi:DNA-binding GntR family transcriptional regulator
VRQRRAVRAKDTEAFFDLDEEFHRLLAAAAGRPSAWHIVEDLKPQMDRVRYLSIEHATPMHVIVAQHTAIAEAVTAGDAPRAEAALHDHLTEILRALPELASRYPDLFEYALSTPLSA